MSEMTWPELSWDAWAETADTLHMWTQMVGKTRMALTPLQNHWWNVPLYVTARGLGTSAMCFDDDVMDIEFDFIAHELHLRVSSGGERKIELRSRTVADFYVEYLRCLHELGLEIEIDPMPVEVTAPVRFDLDTEHAAYDPVYVHRFWRVLVGTQRVFRRFGMGFMGKVSPIHFFWGSFDLAVTRFSGRTAPPRPGADHIQQEAYSREVISAGFWPGNGGYGRAAFYCYAAPVPEGLGDAKIQPAVARWDKGLGEYLFDYDAMRAGTKPDEALLAFLQSAYGAAADAAKWDRAELERR
jgi:Family of unknown function (DUF5996)